jgi:Ulp1 family protease
MFVYKTGNSSISVTWNDYYCLEEGSFLNDTAIEFYIRWMYDQWSDEKQKSCHIFNSFFYQNISSKSAVSGENAKVAVEKKAEAVNYEMVKRWTMNDEIFGSKFVFVPINEK